VNSVYELQDFSKTRKLSIPNLSKFLIFFSGK